MLWSVIYTFLAESTATARGPPKSAVVAPGPSFTPLALVIGLAPPASVVTVYVPLLLLVIIRIRRIPVSAIYKFPEESTAMPLI